jgi:hypothetical protein
LVSSLGGRDKSLLSKEGKKLVRKHWKMRTKHYVLLAASLYVSGCVKNTPANDFCKIYQPIIFSKSLDSVATVERIIDENSKYECVCGGDCE